VIVAPAFTGSGLSPFVTTRSASEGAATAVVDVALLFVVFDSRSVVDAAAVLLMIVPAATDAPTCTTT